MAFVDFTSAKLPTTQQVDAAIEFYSQIGGIHLAPQKDVGFSVASRIAQENPVVVGSFSLSTCLVTRTDSHAEADNPYDVLGIILDSGEVDVQLPGRRGFRYKQGEAFLWPGDEAGSSRYVTPTTRLLNIALPRSVFTGPLKLLDSVSGRRLPASPELRLLATYAGAFLDEYPELQPEAAQKVAGHIQDLALVALGAHRGLAAQEHEQGVRAARLTSMKADIDAHLFDPELSVAWLLRRHRVSERYLRSLFESEGTSFTDYVLNGRLAHVYRRILDPRERTTRISVIAYDSGFNDLSWFNRVFRRYYGMTPSDMRERCSLPQDLSSNLVKQ